MNLAATVRAMIIALVPPFLAAIDPFHAAIGFARAESPASAEPTLQAVHECGYVGLNANRWGLERLAVYTDSKGRSVETWCEHGVFSGRYEIRIAWNEPDSASVTATTTRQVRTIAGCFFLTGLNDGPDILEDSAHAFTSVTWTNRNSNDRRDFYVFRYDWATGKLTITANAPDRTPVVRVVDPPGDFDALRSLLPDP